MYERFTDDARKVMQLANQEAQRFNHEYIATEHVLLGLLKLDDDVDAHVFKKFGLDLFAIRREVEKRITTGPEIITLGKLPQTPAVQRVLKYAIAEAKELNHNHVGIEHLLLALLHETPGELPIATQVLLASGMKLSTTRDKVRGILARNDELNS